MFAGKPKEQPLSPTETAKNEVVRLFQIERDLTAKRREKLAAVEAIQQNVGETIVDGGNIADAAARTIHAQAEVRAVEQAIGRARQRRLEAIRKRYEVEAGELRAAARAKRSEAADILRRAEPLLKKLSELQGVPYTSAILLAERVGDWAPHIFLSTPKPLEDCNPFEAQYEPGIAGPTFAIPRSLALRDEARALEKQAGELESREVHAHGSIARANLEELLGTEELQSPEIFAPAVSAIEDWIEAIERRVQKERPSLVMYNRQYCLKWRGGEIDFDDSSLSLMSAGGWNPIVFTAQ